MSNDVDQIQEQDGDEWQLLPEELADADDDQHSEDAGEQDDSKSAGDDTSGTDEPAKPEGQSAQQAQDDDLIALTERQSELDERIGELESELENLASQFDEGEIGQGKYDAEKSRIDRELQRLDQQSESVITQIAQVNTRAAQTQQAQAEAFAAASSKFLERPENEVFREPGIFQGAFNQMMQQMAASLPATATYDELLDKTRAELAKVMILPGATPEQSQPATKQSKRPDASRIPPDIGGMSAVVQNTPAHRFSHLDALDGVALEDALAEMSETERAAYLKQKG